MRIAMMTMLAAGVMLAAAPGRAQTFGGGYPVCLQAWGPLGGYGIECAYTSIPQCAASASGRSAQCILNPYFTHPVSGRAYPRHGY